MFKQTRTKASIASSTYKLYRYTKINENTRDVIGTDFSAEPFLNVDLGNKSNYLLGETVKVTRLADSSYTHIAGSLDGSVVLPIEVTGEVTLLENLPAGKYVIALSKGSTPTALTPPIEFYVASSTTTAAVMLKTGATRFNPSLLPDSRKARCSKIISIFCEPMKDTR